MTETTAPAAESHSDGNYALYWKAWASLLIITLLMIFFTSTGMIIVGMCAKATIIMAWFMHLKYEKLDFILYVVLSIVVLSAFLFGLIYPDGSVM